MRLYRPQSESVSRNLITRKHIIISRSRVVSVPTTPKVDQRTICMRIFQCGNITSKANKNLTKARV